MRRCLGNSCKAFDFSRGLFTARSLRINKTEEFDRWLRNLRDQVAKRAINTRISRIAVSNFGDSKSVGEGVMELRIHVGPGYRIYFTMVGSEVVLLLVGGDKSSQNQDIDKAKRLANQVRDQSND